MTFIHSLAGRTLMTLTAGLVQLTFTTPAVQAEPVQQPSQQVIINQVTSLGIPMPSNPVPSSPLSIVSASAVVMDLTTGTVVYAKNPLDKHFPASITKIMTAMLALQRGHLDDKLKASLYATQQPADNLDLAPGEVEPLKKLLYGLLLFSANDAAVEIAEKYGGSVQGFADMMNAEAQQLGATHTHFVNPNGLPDPNHTTTAYDMAIIARAAMQNSVFRQIVSTKTYMWRGEQWQSELINLNKMLFNYPGAIGLKTGYTSVAHETLVVAATRNQQTFLAVLMDAPTASGIRNDATQILDYAFQNYQTETLVHKGTRVGSFVMDDGTRIPVATSTDVRATVPVGDSIPVQTRLALTKAGDSIRVGEPQGQLKVLEHGVVVASIPVVSAKNHIIPVHAFPWKDSFILLFILGFVGTMALRVAGSNRHPQPATRVMRNHGYQRGS